MWQILAVFFHVIFDLEKNRVFFNKKYTLQPQGFFIIFVQKTNLY